MEDELQRLILDIHDGAVQKLFAAAAHLALLQAQLNDHPPELRTELEPTLLRSTLLVESALQDIRSTLSTFRRTEFQNYSLPDVLQGLAQQYELLTGHQVEFHTQGDIPAVSLPIKIALYRVLQEGLSNTSRHAQVNKSTVVLHGYDNIVILEIIDEGCGFGSHMHAGSDTNNGGDHIGLNGMRERLQLVGGQLRVISQPGQGTHLIIRIPNDG